MRMELEDYQHGRTTAQLVDHSRDEVEDAFPNLLVGTEEITDLGEPL